MGSDSPEARTLISAVSSSITKLKSFPFAQDLTWDLLDTRPCMTPPTSAGLRVIIFFGFVFVISEFPVGAGRVDVVTSETGGAGSSLRFFGGSASLSTAFGFSVSRVSVSNLKLR